MLRTPVMTNAQPEKKAAEPQDVRRATPDFCRYPEQCNGRGYCPREIACND